MRDVLDANALGFDYADSETLLVPNAAAGTPGAILVTEPVARADAVPAGDFSSAHLEIGGIKHTGSSYEGLVYLNEPGATLETGADPPRATSARFTSSATAAASVRPATATPRTTAGGSTTDRWRGRSG